MFSLDICSICLHEMPKADPENENEQPKKELKILNKCQVIKLLYINNIINKVFYKLLIYNFKRNILHDFSFNQINFSIHFTKNALINGPYIIFNILKYIFNNFYKAFST